MLRVLTLALVLSFAMGISGRGEAQRAEPSGRLVIASSPDWPSLDPQAQGTTTLAYLALYDFLVALNEDFDEIVPSLATSWEMIEDDRWRFKLREGVTFHNGEPFNAEVVRFTLDRVRNHPGGTYFGALLGAEVVDDYTVDIVTDGPFPGLLGRLTGLAMIPPGFITEHGDDAFSLAGVGTGPFRLGEWVRDSHTVFIANRDYWGEVPLVEELVVRIVPDSTAAAAGLLAGEIDIVVAFDPSLEDRVVSAGHRVVSEPSLRIMYAFLRGDLGGPLADRRVRQAINYSIDREAIIETIFAGRADLIPTVTFPGVVGHDPSAPSFNYDPERALALLEEAGYPNAQGIPTLTFTTPSDRYPFDRESAEVIAAYLEAIGFSVDLDVVEWGIWQDRFYNRGVTDIFLAGMHNIPLDGEQAFSRMIQSGTHNYWNDSDEYDEAILAAATELDPVRRQELHEKLHRIWHDEAALMFLYQLHDVYGVHSRVVGFEGVPADYPRFTNVGVE